MNGKELQKIVRSSGFKLKELAEKSKIPEPTIYSLYKKNRIEDHYMEKLQSAGLNFSKKPFGSVVNSAFEEVLLSLSDRLDRIYAEHNILKGRYETLEKIVIGGDSERTNNSATRNYKQ